MGTGRFKGIKEASYSKGSGSFFKEGIYRVKILGVKWVKSQKGGAQKREFFIIETEVLKSNNAEIAVGSQRSHVIPMDNVMSLPNVKGFVAAASGVDPDEANVNDAVAQYWSTLTGESVDFEDVCDWICGPSNPLKDEEMDLECIPVKTQAGGDFTKHAWMPRDTSEDSEASAAAN